jgi:hypothetical protein
MKVMRKGCVHCAVLIALTAALVACPSSADGKHPHGPQYSLYTPTPHGPPPTVPAAEGRTVMELPFNPSQLAFSAGSSKLYVFDVTGKPATYVVPMGAPADSPRQLDPAISDGTGHIVVNDQLKRGYSLVRSGVLNVFNTDTDTLVSTTDKPGCSPQVLAISHTTGMVYGGGMSAKGECLVQFDSDGHIVRENVVAPLSANKNRMVQRIEVDSASGDVVYTDPYSVGRADPNLVEIWRMPVASPGQAQDLGFEPKTNTVYVTVGDFPVISPTKITVVDGRTGKQRAEFSGPGFTNQFAAAGDGRLFVAFFNSNDLYVLSDGSSTLTRFGSLGDIPGSSPSDPKWLVVDTAGQRLFVSPGGDVHQILVYRY